MESTKIQPWHPVYPDDVPKEIDPEKYDSLLELLEQSFRKYPKRVAFENFGKSMTYEELDFRSRDFAAWLQNAGMRKGERIAIQMPNLLQFPIVMFGAMRAGLIVVNTNPLYTPKEMMHQFRDSGARAIVILSNFAANLEKIIDNTGIEKVIVTDLADNIGGIKGWVMNFVVKHFKKMVPKYNLPGHIKLKHAMKEARLMSYSKPPVHINDIAFLQYTGGTTGISKGASLTHRNIIANMEQIFAWVQPHLREKQEVIITALPLYHIFALTVNCLAFFRVGGKNILVTNPRDIPGLRERTEQA